MVVFKTLFFVVLIPLPLLVWAPYKIALADPGGRFLPATLRYAAFLPWAAGAAVLLWSCREFVVRGRGTPAPVDPPRFLVDRGLYRYVRNPMYLGALGVLLGQVLWFRSVRLLVCAAVLPVVFHLFVIWYEEPFLRRRFGEAYRRYCHEVPRWMPHFRKKGGADFEERTSDEC